MKCPQGPPVSPPAYSVDSVAGPTPGSRTDRPVRTRRDRRQMSAPDARPRPPSPETRRAG